MPFIEFYGGETGILISESGFSVVLDVDVLVWYPWVVYTFTQYFTECIYKFDFIAQR